jgi:hypothetical protein
MKNIIFLIATIVFLAGSSPATSFVIENQQGRNSSTVLEQQVFMEELYYDCEFIPEFPSVCIMFA